MKSNSARMFLALLGMAIPPLASADADPLLLCAVTRGMQCHVEGDCIGVDVGELNLPRFVTVDFKNDVIYGTRPDGTEARTRFRSSFRGNDRAMVLGVENGRAWNMLIGVDGELVVSASDIDRTISLFGYCTTK